MKNKAVKVLITIVVTLVVILTVCIVKDNRITAEEKQFKMEYEKLNGKKSLSTKKEYMKLDIPAKNGIQYVSSKRVVDILNEGTGVVYFGFPECPWCRNVVVPLIEVLKEENVSNVYYCNAYAIRDDKALEDGKVITRVEGTEEYYKILELLGDYADAYDGLNDDSIKRLYFPTVVFIKNGKIVDVHTSTVTSQKNPYKKLTEKQEKELKNIYKEGIRKMNHFSTSEICTGKESC